MRRIALMCAVLCLAVTAAYGQTPVITDARNAASFLSRNLPNGGAARNALITFFGTNLGPAQAVLASAFPLQLNLGGVTAKLTAGGATFDVYPIVAFSTQTSLMIPSAAPIGSAQVAITYNGQTSAPFTINIVGSAPGMFALNEGGSGPTVATNAANPLIVNSLVASASPGEDWDFWVTGLGAKAGDEAAGPTAGQISGVDVKVMFGGTEVTPTYSGGSGCCASLDIVRAKVPAGVSGCFVPVTIIANGVPSNAGTMSINQGGGTCSNGALSPEIINGAWTSGALRIGEIDLTRMSLSLGGFDTTNDVGNASFRQLDRKQLITTQGLGGDFFGNNACYVFTFKPDEEETTIGPEDPAPDRYLAAGPEINVMHSGQTRAIELQSVGQYSSILGSSLAILGRPAPYLSGGAYNYNNGPGGADVGAFTATANFPDPATWTNMEAIFNIPGGQGLNVTWTGVQGSAMMIIGTSINESLNVAAGFICQANGSAGQFTVPGHVVDALPPTGIQEGFPTGMLMLFSASEPQKGSAPGLDVLFLNYSSGAGKIVSYHTVADEPTIPGGGGGGGVPPGGGGGSGFSVTSTSWANGGVIPGANAFQACGGQNISPQLSFASPPAGTASYAVLMDDPDAGEFIHWALWGIPASTTSIPAGNPGGIGIAAGNDFGQTGYGGPCPPAQHTYRIRVFAMDATTTAALQALPAGTEAATLKPFLNALTMTALGTATYTGTFAP